MNRYIKYISTSILMFCTFGLNAKDDGFIDDLLLKDVANQYVDQSDTDPGHTEFQLLTDYRYVDKQGHTWTVPANVVVNGASIPKAVWSVVGGPWSGKYRNASVLHDWMCQQMNESSKFTHRLFHEAMLVSGVSRSKAGMMYFAVLKYGPKWKQGSGFLEESTGMPSEKELEDIYYKLINEADFMLTSDYIESLVE